MAMAVRWVAYQQSGAVVQLVKASSRHKTSARAQARKWNAMARRGRLQNSLRRKGELLIADRILRLLAAAELPLQKQAYQQKLRELLGD
jgi:hypothetical protein